MKHQPKVRDAIIAFRTNNVFKAAAVGLAKREDMTLTQLCRKAIRQYIVRAAQPQPEERSRIPGMIEFRGEGICLIPRPKNGEKR